MIKKLRQGFTLIEILIVVAIIAILASVVLVGLGPTQQAGRDARRLSDIREVQNALELFYNKCGYYPGTITGAGACAIANPASWKAMGTNLSAAASNLGISSVPSDPSSNRTYAYYIGAGNATYALGVALENANNSVLINYTAPAGTAADTYVSDATTITPAASCTGVPTGGAGATYCISL